MPKRTDMRTLLMRLLAAIVLRLLLLLTPSMAAACSISYTPIPVGSSFSVLVTVRGHGVPSVEVELQHLDTETIKTRVVGKAHTDATGRATFQNVPKGGYFVRTEFLWMRDEPIEVGNAADRRTEITLEWPNGEKGLTTREFAGVLRGTFDNSTDNRVFNIAFPVHAPVRNASLCLVDPISGKTVWKGETDGNGSFSAAHLSPGLYVFHVEETQLTNPSMKLEGDIPVEISPESPSAGINVQVGMSSCGLHYTSGCDHPKLEIDRACGVIHDSEGAAVGGASLLLYGLGQERTAKATADAAGSFNLQEVPPGLYQLIIGRAGFSNAEVEVSVSGLNECRRPLDITLNVMGVCSTAMVK